MRAMSRSVFPTVCLSLSVSTYFFKLCTIRISLSVKLCIVFFIKLIWSFNMFYICCYWPNFLVTHKSFNGSQVVFRLYYPFIFNIFSKCVKLVLCVKQSNLGDKQRTKQTCFYLLCTFL